MILDEHLILENKYKIQQTELTNLTNDLSEKANIIIEKTNE